MHETSLRSGESSDELVGKRGKLSMFRTPLALMKRFSASGEHQGDDERKVERLEIAALRGIGDEDSSSFQGMEIAFATAVADYRAGLEGQLDAPAAAVARALLDLCWGAWVGHFDEEIEELCVRDKAADTSAASGAFLWHRYLSESSGGLGEKHRAFAAAATRGPIAASSSNGAAATGAFGFSELGAAEQADVKKVQEALAKLRRQKVNFTALPPASCGEVGGFSLPQLQKMWETMRLGHRFTRKKSDVRAFVLSADLFAPNVAKHGAVSKLDEEIAVDAARLKRTLDFIAGKRSKEDLVILFDGRSKRCRRQIEDAEEQLAASGAHRVKEFWIVYSLPAKVDDPRASQRPSSFAANNREVCICSMPVRRGITKILARSEFNVCGESSTASTTYSGVQLRRYCELPRMSYDTKSTILGNSASGEVEKVSVRKDIGSRGHPFSHCEGKPITFWQRLMEHFGVTHIVDFSPGSAALAVAAAGAQEYEGIATCDAHREWLDQIMDRCTMFMAVRDKAFLETLGSDLAFIETIHKYFAGTMMEARRYFEPLADDDDERDGADDDETDTDKEG